MCHKLSRKSLETMYLSYVRIVLENADILFCNTSQENLKQIDNIQKRAGKIVSGAIRCTSFDAIYEELSWQRLSDRRDNRITIAYSDIIRHRASSSSTHSRNCIKQNTSLISPEKPLKFIMPYIQNGKIGLQKSFIFFYDFILEQFGRKCKTS